jgi:hypothetical protein
LTEKRAWRDGATKIFIKWFCEQLMENKKREGSPVAPPAQMHQQTSRPLLPLEWVAFREPENDWRQGKPDVKAVVGQFEKKFTTADTEGTEPKQRI